MLIKKLLENDGNQAIVLKIKNELESIFRTKGIYNAAVEVHMQVGTMNIEIFVSEIQ